MMKREKQSFKEKLNVGGEMKSIKFFTETETNEFELMSKHFGILMEILPQQQI
jgi:ABC-type multidrug transport system permease subunit